MESRLCMDSVVYGIFTGMIIIKSAQLFSLYYFTFIVDETIRLFLEMSFS